MIVESSYFRAGEMEGPSTGLRCDLQRASYLSRWARGMLYKGMAGLIRGMLRVLVGT